MHGRAQCECATSSAVASRRAPADPPSYRAAGGRGRQQREGGSDAPGSDRGGRRGAPPPRPRPRDARRRGVGLVKWAGLRAPACGGRVMARECHCAERPRAERRPEGRYSGSNPVIARGSAEWLSGVHAWPSPASLAAARAWDECARCAVALPVCPAWWAWILLLCAWGRAARRENPDALCMRPWCVLYR